jgi:hypothetical protein
LVIGFGNFGSMVSKKKTIRRISALEQIVAKLREDVDTLKQHKMDTIAEGTRNKHTTSKMKVSIGDVIFNYGVVRSVIIHIIIEFIRIIVDILLL